ncbi:MAG: hypothetical protein JO370_00145 [Paucibacter sp.]|nr:hypothetical protein [Roseateles sp.]
MNRRRAQLDDLRLYLRTQEQDYEQLHQQLNTFIARYLAQLEPLYLELDALESQLHQATTGIYEALRHHGVDVSAPTPPQATPLPKLNKLPGSAPLPDVPSHALVHGPAPTLKQLYRRAAMRLHPDLASSERERHLREQQMRSANEAYALGDRSQLASLLLDAGEDPLKVHGSNGDAVLEALRRTELAVQGRLRVVQAHRVALEAHPMHQLWQAIVHAEAKGLDPLNVMANRLKQQIAERRQEVYIGQRLDPAEADLASAFLHQRAQRQSGDSGGSAAQRTSTWDASHHDR